MRVLMDENVDEHSVRTFFEGRGYEVRAVSEVLGKSSPDQLIAFTAGTHGLVVVTHDPDFRRFTQLLPAGTRRTYRRGAGRIILAVDETEAASRLAEVIDLIEMYYERSVRLRKRLYVRVTKTSVEYNDQEADLPRREEGTGE
ncbi:MAG: DUF5615 family PIN-like protein [Chloroflexota bacterium]|nr:DUF5615 family PIN-like protein [Chloroflexota bacterium]